MSRYDMVVRGGTNFDDHYPATSLGFTHEKTEEIPETAVAKEDL
jgi:hypothetical protein